MSATHFTFYRVKNELDWQGIIDDFNEGRRKDECFIEKESANYEFNNVSQYKLYTRKATSIPEWQNTLDVLVKDLERDKNASQSFVLFMKVSNVTFVATAGQGYNVLWKVKDYEFGFELLSRLIEKNDDVVKRVNDRFFTGNVLGSSSMYNRRVTINTEADFNNFFKEIQVAMPSEIIKEKLGIDIKTKKKDYRFLAKDSIRLGKAITVNEMDKLLGSVELLLQEEGFDINPFYKLDDKDPLQTVLDEKLIDSFIDLTNSINNSRDFTIVPYYQDCDVHFIHINNIPEPYETEEEIIEIFQKHVNTDKELDKLLKIVKSIKLTGIVEGAEVESANLYQHFDVKIRHEGETYWLMDGNWYRIKRIFIEEMNNKFRNKISDIDKLHIYLEHINSWQEGESEGEFNHDHNEIPSVYVLDKILYKYVELCDLLLVEEDHVYFVHVKDGLAGNTRILSEQIEQAMHIIEDALLSDNTILKEYYNSIINKINDDNKTESQISEAARKFRNDFPEYEDFHDTLKNKDNISFIFAFRPKESNDIRNPESILSTAAKMSMVALIQSVKKFEKSDLKFMEIERSTNNS